MPDVHIEFEPGKRCMEKDKQTKKRMCEWESSLGQIEHEPIYQTKPKNKEEELGEMPNKMDVKR